MTNFNVQAFMDSLSAEMQEKVKACKTEEELAVLIEAEGIDLTAFAENEEDVELTLEDLEGVGGGRGFLQTALASVIMFTSAGAMVASPTGGTIFNDTAITASADSAQIPMTPKEKVDAFLLEKSIWAGKKAFEKYVPFGEQLSPYLDNLLVWAGLQEADNTPSMADINQNITEMRAELNKKLDDLEANLDQSTTEILNKIKNQSFLDGFGTELDDMHTATRIVASQIKTISEDPTLTEEERTVEIAALIGKNTEWSDTGKLVYRLNRVGDMLAGESVSQKDARDFYQVLYEDEMPNVMFSGEAYDNISPYVERVMYEYFYSYSVISQCLEAAERVSQYDDSVTEKFSRKMIDYDYISTVSLTSIVVDEIIELNDMIYNADKANSVISHYAAFRYKQQNDRNVFVNKGKNGAGIAISSEVKETHFDMRTTAKDSYTYSWSNNPPKTNYNNAKASIDAAIGSNVIKTDELNELYSYVYRTYPDMSFTDYLKSMGIDTSTFENSDNKFFPSEATSAEHITVGTNNQKFFNAGFGVLQHKFSLNERQAINDRLDELYNLRSDELGWSSKWIKQKEKSAYDAEIAELEAKKDLISIGTVFTHVYYENSYRQPGGNSHTIWYEYWLKETNDFAMLTFQTTNRTVAPALASETVDN